VIRRGRPLLVVAIRRYAAVLAFAALLLGGAAIWAWNWQGFRVRAIEVAGNRVVPSAEIVRGAAIDRGSNLWLQSRRRMIERIEAIPYVGQAVIHRRLPADVTIVVSERRPAGCLDTGRGEVTIDSANRVLQTGCADPEEVRYAAARRAQIPPGSFVDDAKLNQLETDEHAAEASGLLMRRLSFDRYGSLEIVLDNGITLRFGDDATLGEKLPLVRPILDAVAKKQASVRAVDLRAATTPVVQYR
jgi:cell division septal protein FtsQ